ncbi:MAG: hypothetical protein ACOX2X_04695 [Peptococcia bacterium]
MGLFGSLIGGAVSSAIGRAIERAKNKSSVIQVVVQQSSSGGVQVARAIPTRLHEPNGATLSITMRTGM